MPFAAAMSEHPVPALATGEVIGQVVDSIGEAPDVAALFLTAPFLGAVEDMTATVRAVLKPRVLIGATAVSVLGGPLEAEEQPAVSLWAGRLPAPLLRAVRLDDAAAPLPAGSPTDGTLVVLADPFSFDVAALLAGLAETAPGLAVVGGMASAARGPGGNRLVLDDQVHRAGAVGFLVDRTGPVSTVVSQGCRPIGRPFTVTRAEQNVLYELGGQPAYERLQQLVEAADPHERHLLAQGVHLGVVVDEHRTDFERGDFVIRNLLGADREVGALAAGDVVPVGTTVQFQVRDASTADEDLDELLDTAPTAAGALLFTCNGRGRHLFDVAHHDAAAVAARVKRGAVAGMFCAGELGPIGGANFLHGFTASIALFTDPS